MSGNPEIPKPSVSRSASWRPSLPSLSRKRNSFFLHLRPPFYQPASVLFSATWYLGFLSVFFLVLEFLTGIILMVYYVPTPDSAYGSVIRIATEVPYGWLLRDLHRLGGECMVIVVIAHLVKVFWAGAYVGSRQFTWVTGVFLLICTLFLAFSGYLLPWDQLAFWAVTIGTGIVETTPFIGSELLLLLRGGPEFGADGLLRFYLLHIIILPMFMSGALAIHYYRVSRLHSSVVSPKVHIGRENVQQSDRTPKIPLLPDVVLLEVIISLLLITLLIFMVTFYYNAPLQHHADPNHTPVVTTAPWFFLWLQGALKLGDSFLIGVGLPAGLLVLLFSLPYIPAITRLASHRILSGFVIATATALLAYLTFLGQHTTATKDNEVTTLLEQIAPEEGKSLFHAIPFDHLPQGIYEMNRNVQIHNSLGRALLDIRNNLSRNINQSHFSELQYVITIEDWQANLKRITVRFHWINPNNKQLTSIEKMIFRHSNTGTHNQ
jgi:quinol-cytochrome oxidoreductase complex cytochrome b subunit